MEQHASDGYNSDAQADQLRKRRARNEAIQKGLISELAQIGDSTSPVAVEYLRRIREHTLTCITPSRCMPNWKPSSPRPTPASSASCPTRQGSCPTNP